MWVLGLGPVPGVHVGAREQKVSRRWAGCAGSYVADVPDAPLGIQLLVEAYSQHDIMTACRQAGWLGGPEAALPWQTVP